jgi:hypothetical protein
MPAINANCVTFITAPMVRTALKAWRDHVRLGRHPLGQMRFLAQRCDSQTLANPIERAHLLRRALQAGIEELRPGPAAAELSDPLWRRYVILREQYLARRSPASVASEICLESSGYYAEQRRALHHLALVLNGWEIEARRGDPLPSVFLAPALSRGALLGRDTLLATVKLRLMAGESVALHGLPGIGKSALAVALANDPDVFGHFADGVLWAHVADCGEAFDALGEWGAALGLAPPVMSGLKTSSARARAVRAAIGMRRMLIVIDCAGPTDAALALRAGGPNCAQLFAVPSARIAIDVAGANATYVSELREADGLALLTRHAPEVIAGRQEAALRIVRDVGGLPFALALIGRWLHREGRTGSQRRIARAFERLADAGQRMDLTEVDPSPCRMLGTCEGSAASMRSLLRESTARLDEAARRALGALSTFPPKPGTFSEAAAWAVCAVSVEALDELVDSDLLECQGDRYALHPVIADFGRSMADQSTTEPSSAWRKRP